MVTEGGETVILNEVGRSREAVLFEHVPSCERQELLGRTEVWCPSVPCSLRSVAPAGRMRPFLGLCVCAVELHIFGTGVI